MTDSPKRKGRPALPPGEKKEWFPLRMSPNAKTLVERAAEHQGEEVQVWVRKVLTERAKVVLCITD